MLPSTRSASAGNSKKSGVESRLKRSPGTANADPKRHKTEKRVVLID